MSGNPKTDTSGLTQLGRPVGVPASPEDAALERVPNPHPGIAYCVRFTAPEFTSLCPLTGQPDSARRRAAPAWSATTAAAWACPNATLSTSRRRRVAETSMPS